MERRAMEFDMNTKTQSHKDTRAQEHMSTGTPRVHVCTCALVLTTLLVSVAWAGSTNLGTYYPAPFGSYDRLRLVPLADRSGEDCDPGTLYVNQTSGQLQICNASRNWDTFSDPFWAQSLNNNPGSDDYLYPTSINDKVAIGTGTTAEFRLNLGNDTGKDGGIIAKGTYGSGIPFTSTQEDARFLWYPRNAAFHTEYVNWINANSTIGNYSFATGYGTTASGNYSIAIGREMAASGDNSTAIAFYDSTVSGPYATIIGKDVIATAANSTALGHGTLASGQYATAMGDGTEARAFASLVAGQNNVISGTTNSWVLTDPLFAIGNGASSAARSNAFTVLKDSRVGINVPNPTSTGLNPNMEFKLTIDKGVAAGTADGGIFAVGTYNPANVALTTLADYVINPPTSNKFSRLIWYPKKAAFRAGELDNDSSRWNDANIGSYSVAMGQMPEAKGDYAVSLGYWTQATGTNSIAMSKDTQATGNTAIAIGEQTTASGNQSVAMGNHTTASNHAAMAMGLRTTASGDSATAMGYYTTARAYASLAIGQCNVVAGTESQVGWTVTDPVFIIGNGTWAGGACTSTSNAVTVLKNGGTTVSGILDASKGLIIENQTQALGNAESNGHFWLCTDCP